MHQFDEVMKLLEKTTNYYIICTDMAGKYNYINHNYADRFRYVNEDLIGKDMFITVHADDIDSCRIAGMKAISDKDALVPVSLRKHDGKGDYIVTQWEFKAIIGHDGTPQGVFCLGYDITDFMNKLAGKDRLLRNIAFNQSHIVRRPVANILGAINLLNDIAMPEQAKELLDMLKESTEELDEIIQKISDDIYG